LVLPFLSTPLLYVHLPSVVGPTVRWPPSKKTLLFLVLVLFLLLFLLLFRFLRATPL